MEKKILSLHEKMVLVRSEIPALVKKAYSDQVNYDFTKIDDIFRYLAPAMKNHMVDWVIISEEASRRDSGGNPCYLTYIEKNFQWLYEADLTIRWINAEAPAETEEVKLHLIGTHEMPEKAKGCAWTYALKYYLQDLFCADQGGEDPDMRSGEPQYQTSATPKQPVVTEQALSSELLDEGFEIVAEQTVFDEQPTRIERESENLYAGEVESDREFTNCAGTDLPASEAHMTGCLADIVAEEFSVCLEEPEVLPEASADSMLPGADDEGGIRDGAEETDDAASPPNSSYILPGKEDMVKLPSGVRKRERAQKVSDISGEETPEMILKEAADPRPVQKETARPVSDQTGGIPALGTNTSDQNGVSISLEEACGIKIKVGIHKGKSLGQLASLGKEGIEMLAWYADNYRGSDEKLKQGAKLLLQEARKAA